MRSPDTVSKTPPPVTGEDRRQQEFFEASGSVSQSTAAELLRSFHAYLLLVANRELDPKLQGKVAPSDVVQQTYVNAEENIAGFRGKTREELQAWLRQILLNNLTDVRRRYISTQKRSVAREQSFDGDSRAERPADYVAADTESPRASMIAREETKAMQSALDRLPGDYRMVIELRSLQELPFSDVAQLLDRSENAVRKLWSRAILRLQEELTELDGDASR